MENQVEETGTERLRRLRVEAKKLGIVGTMSADEFEAAIQAKADGTVEVATKGGLTAEEAIKIDARLKYEEEARQKIRREHEIKIERASIIVESESLRIPVDLPENPTELQLAKARQTLGIKKKEKKPSPETVGIESSKRGYYVFTNQEQNDAGHRVNLGGKYVFNLIPYQIHVLSEFHIRRWRRIAITPIYGRVPIPGPEIVGELKEECKRTGSRPRFMFDHLGEAPADAPFGLVTNIKVLDELKQEQLT